MQSSPWLDCRFQIPIDVMIPMLEAQTHRRVREIAPAVRCAADLRRGEIHPHGRGGLDACFSFHNHFLNFTPQATRNISEIDKQDGGTGEPPATPEDPREFFHSWMANDKRDGISDGRHVLRSRAHLLAGAQAAKPADGPLQRSEGRSFR
jgi:aryl sulfotransferase